MADVGRTLAELGLDGLKKELLDVTSVSFAMIELHDKNYLNVTASETEDTPVDGEEKDDFYGDTINGIEENEALAKRYTRWQTQQPHFITK